MRRGTRVGQAYIALTADGSGINDDIVDSMDDVDFDDLGDRHGREYSDSMRAHLDNMTENFREMARRANEAFDADDAISRNIHRSVADSFNNGDLDHIMAELGERTGTEYGDAFSESMRRSVMESVERNMRDAALRGNTELEGMFASRGQDEDGGGGFRVPGALLNQITDQAEAEYRRQVAEMERRVQSDREAVWRLGQERHLEFEREFSELLAEEERLRTFNAQREQSDREAVWRMAAEREARREEESARVYEALQRGETDRLARSLEERAQLEDDDARRRNRERLRYEAEFARLLEEQEREQAIEQNRRDEEFARMERQRDDDRFRRFDEMARRMTRDIRLDPRINTEQINASLRRLRADLEAQDDIRLRLNADLPVRERERIQAELEGIRARIRVSLDEDALNRTMLRAQGIVDRAGSNGRGIDWGGRIGKMFGAGSRNNFLNIIGKSIGGIVKGMTSLASTGMKVFSTFADGAAQAGANAGVLAKAGSGMSAVFAEFAVSGPVALAAIAAIILAASALVSVLSALLAIVVALSATIVSALAGAALVGAAGLGAIAAAAGLATVAFTSMTDAQKELLKTSFAPLKEELTGIGQLLLGPMTGAFSTWSRNIQVALQPLGGIAERVGQGFANAGNTLTRSFSGPGFQAFIHALGVYLPSIMDRLAGALGGFFNGLLSVFAILMPYVNQFAGYLQAVATRFQNWANSAQGRNTIVDWIDRALASLKSLWNATREVMGFITDLLFSPQAQEAGNTIFDGIARTFEGFRRKIAEAAADGSLRKWFQDAIDFGAKLWGMFEALGRLFVALYDSGVLAGVGDGFTVIGEVLDALTYVLGPVMDFFGIWLPASALAATIALKSVALAASAVREAGEGVLGFFGVGNGAEWDSVGKRFDDITQSIRDASAAYAASQGGSFAKFQPKDSGGGDILPDIDFPNISLGSLQSSGSNALDATSEDAGGRIPDEWKNPYVKYAESLMQQGPTIARQIKDAMAKINKEVAAAMRDAARAANAGEARTAIQGVMDSMRSNIEGIVNSARSDLDAAASRLSSASSQEDANKALREVARAQAALQKALTAQRQINVDARFLAAQKVVNWDRVRQLQYGIKVEGATLADFAAARERMAGRIAKANEALTAAIELRDSYRSSVTDATRQFAGLLTAQAQTINGVQQALTYQDITKNLQDRLAAIRKFQADLRILLANGLSNDAYKQLVDGGVETGGAYAAALVEGGQGAIQQVNGLTSQIDNAANALGIAASNRMYQAGVDSARGLVQGLESMSAQLDRAAVRLGNSIARAIKRTLGIHSPSTVMRDLMNPVGDGVVVGLDAQGGKVDAAASRFASRIAVSPEVAEYDAAQRAAGSGFSETPGKGDEHHWHITTPTEDPEAVAREAINEMTGRIG